MLKIVYLIIISYLIGCIPTGYLLVRIAKKEDIRKHGSGNIGFTNVLRTAGIFLGITVLVIDICKAFFATYYFSSLVELKLLYGPIFGITIILGNIFNPFLQFKGGKGVATGVGVALAISPLSVLCSVSAFAIVVVLTRYVSLGSLTGATVFTLCNILFYFIKGMDIYTVIFSILLFLAVVIKHISNIKRLILGEERKIGKRAKYG